MLIVCLILLILLIPACNKKKNKNQPKNKYDGQYQITCRRQNVYIAVGNISVKESKLHGSIVNTNNQEFTIKGMVDQQGVILFNTIKTRVGRIAAVGKIEKDGTVEGMYSVDTQKGQYTGFQYKPEEITKEYDGNYRLTFKRNDVVTASSTIKIIDGKFSSMVQTDSNVKYMFSGKVLRNGKIVTNTFFYHNKLKFSY